MIRRFIQDQSGATAIEYALIASLFMIGCITAVTNFGVSLTGVYQTIVDQFENINEGNNPG